MSKNNVRIAIRDSTDSHNVAFFDNKAGIKYKSANLQRFLAGSASILTIKYNSKDIDSIRSGCKLAFRYKNRDYWLNVMNFEKKGFEVELTAYSLGLELNNETRGEHKPANAMSIAEYVAYYDPEHSLTIGVNEVSSKRIKLEWTGTDTILARLFSVANSFGAELDFSVELNDDYSLKRQVLNIYKKGNLGTNKVSQPVRVGKELKVINYSDNIKELRTAVRATGKDGLTIDGLDKKIYDNNKELLYYSSGMTVYAPQSRDRFPSVGKGSNDNWIVKDLGETQYETKEALWGYMYGEIQKISVPEITYEVEGAIEAGIGDTQTLIDDIHFEPALYVQARISELEDDILTGKVTKSTFINFERQYSQIADSLLKQVEALAEDAAPYIIRLSTNNGYIFKNGEGSSTITARLEKYSKDIAATWKWVVDNKVVGTGDKLTVKAEQVTNTMAVTVIAYVNGNEVVRDYMTFSNSDDGVGVESIDRYFTSSDQSDGVTIEGAEWSDKPPAPTEDGKYLWAYDEITYTDGTVTTTKPAAVGANFDVDAFRAEIAEDLKDVPNREEFENKIAEEIANSKAEIGTQIETAKTQAESNAKEYADTINQETTKVAEQANTAANEINADLVNVKNNLTATSLVANNAQAAVDEAKQELAEVASELNTAKQDLTNSVDAVNTKVDSAKAELTQAKQDLMSHAQQLQTQANAQTELTKRVTTVETTANGTKTTVNELTKTVAQNGKDITSVTNRTKTVEDDLANTKTTLRQVQTTADSASQKTATLETGLNGLTAKFNSLKIGGRNLLSKTNQGKTNWSWAISSGGTTAENYDADGVNAVKLTRTSDASFTWHYIRYDGLIRNLIEPDTKYTLSFDVKPSVDVTFSAALKRSNGNAPLTNSAKMNKATANRWTNVSCVLTSVATLPDDLSQVVYLTGMPVATGNWLIIKNIKLEKGNVATDYSPSDVDIEQKIAEYKQTADQNYASLSSTVQTLDGQVQSNKTTAEQTAQGFSTRIESLETYKDGESERANAYFESAKTETAKQLTAERTAIANNYVAKSTYTSDVTGIRNELSATTSTANATKTNLANYQASNDKVVASLKSSLQTTDGNVSNLQTKVEAVPGQITSAVSAVEGKIPTSVGGRNLALDTSADWSAGLTSFNGQDKQAITIYRVYNRGFKIGDKVNVRLVLKYSDIAATEGQRARVVTQFKGNVTAWGEGQLDGGGWFWFDKSDGEIELKGTTVVSEYILKNKYWEWRLRVDYVKSGKIQWKEAKVEVGDLPTPWSPAPEDTVTQISSLSSQIQQTADGMTLLATKTELNTAKNELQSGINTATNKANAAQNTANNNAQTISTHTTQISALNTGLQAKVSQTDFNTLSGRVTTAENNITAKANELSSKISSVEGKIPANLDSLNLMTGTRDWSTKTHKWHMGANWSTESEEYQGLKVHSTQKGWNGSHQNIFVKNGDVITFSFFAKATNTLSKIKVSSRWPDSSVYQGPLAGVRESDEEITITSEWKRYSKTVHITSDGSLQFRTEYNGATIPNGNTFYVAGLKLAKTSQDTGYSENLADVASDISGIAGKIPTSVWVRNYALKTGDSKSSSTAGDKLYDLSSAFDGIADDATLIIEFDWSVTASTSTSKFRINRVIKYSDGTAEQWNDTIVKDGVYTDVSSSSGSGHYSGTFTKVPYNGKAVSERYLHLNQTTSSGTVTISNLSVRVGSLKSDWQPAPEDAISQINSVSSEFKQTTDSIKASVQSLDNNTVKSSSLTINTDGVVIKAGKSTSDFANAVGSYFSVNQNAINLFSDKINVKGNMIVSGAITSDKIASKQINTAHLNGKIITADVISSNAVTADAIKAGAVTTDKMNANSINGDRITAGTLDAAKIRAGSITASQIASGTITSAQIKAGTISSANIATGAITTDKIAAGAIDANKIAANAITANMIRGGQLNSTNGATVFDLNAGTLTFNNNYGYIQRVASDKVFEITTNLGTSSGSREYLTSAFKIRKSDYSRLAGAEFTLYNTGDNKPTAQAKINADSLILSDSQRATLFTVDGRNTYLGNVDFHGWGDIPVATLFGGLIAKDIAIGGHTESLLKIVDELCKKAGILWV